MSEDRKEEFISQKIFCLRMGISRSTFKKFIKEGVVKYDKTKPHVNSYLLEWYSNRDSVIKNSRDPSRYTPGEIAKRQKERRLKRYATEDAVSETENAGEKSPDELLEIEEPEDADGEFDSNMSKREAEAVKQLYLAKQAKLKYLKDAGVVVESARVVREWEEIAHSVQKAMLAIPARVSELFASMTDAKEIEQMMTEEIVHGLTRLHYEHKVEVGESSEEDADKTSEEDKASVSTSVKKSKKNSKKREIL